MDVDLYSQTCLLSRCQFFIRIPGYERLWDSIFDHLVADSGGWVDIFLKTLLPYSILRICFALGSNLSVLSYARGPCNWSPTRELHLGSLSTALVINWSIWRSLIPSGSLTDEVSWRPRQNGAMQQQVFRSPLFDLLDIWVFLVLTLSVKWLPLSVVFWNILWKRHIDERQHGMEQEAFLASDGTDVIVYFFSM